MNTKAICTWLLGILAVMVMVSIITAQQSAPAITQPNAEQKARLTELARTWDRESREAETAKDKYIIALVSIMAELGHKPSETTVSWNAQGEPVFARVEAAKAQPSPKE